MEALEALRRRLKTTDDLRSIVKTMKVMAMVNLRQFERAVESLAEYDRTLTAGLQAVVAGSREWAPEPAGGERRLAAFVFGSDQGLCGQFNERIAAFALDALERSGVPAEDRLVLAVGWRVQTPFALAGLEFVRGPAVPGSLAGVTQAAQDLLLQLDRWREHERINEVVLLYNTPVSAAAFEPQEVRLLPLDTAWLRDLAQQPWPSRGLPMHTMDASRLFSALVRQRLFVWVYRALVESLAAENASRLAAMQAAERNIEERLAELLGRYHQQRQASITSELLEVVSGYELLAATGATDGKRING